MRYSIVREIGKGGMGSVYEGRDLQGNKVAVKMMSKSVTCYPEYRQLFDMEVRTLKKMNNPSIVKILGEPFSDEEGNLYLPMEYVEGETIEQYVAHEGAYSEEKAKKMMCKILDALSYIHQQGSIHRDIKPSNIMIRPSGDICIIDFGIAKDVHVSTGKTVGRIIGTDGYMSPEQAKGDNIDHRTDIYSLGCVLFYLLTGKNAIEKKQNDYATVCSILDNDFPNVKDYNSSVSDELQNIILKAVDKNMTCRYQTASDFKNALSGNDVRTTLNKRVSVSIGHEADNDVIIDSEYVSRHHAVIEYYEDFPPRSFVYIDNSTNGTGIDGRFVRHESVTSPYSGDIDSLPQVLLAGRPECMLDWHKVLDVMAVHVNMPSSPSISTVTTPTVPRSVDDGQLGIGYAILCILCPIVGWVLWGVWKNDKPSKARKASRMGWIGFFVNLVVSIISNLL